VIVAKGDFISSILLEYAYPFAAEIYGVLATMVMVNYLLTKYPNSAAKIRMKIGSDC